MISQLESCRGFVEARSGVHQLMRMGKLSLHWVCLALCFGCADSWISEPPLVEEVDSAGIELLTLRNEGIQNLLGDSSTALSPIVSVMHDDLIRGMGALAVGPDGWIISQAEPPFFLRIRDGGVVASAGRRGSGPSEFGEVALIGGDSSRIFSYDSERRRMARLDRHTLSIESSVQLDVESFRAEGLSPRLMPIGWTPDGGLFGAVSLSEQRSFGPGINAEIGVLVYVDPSGSLKRQLSPPFVLRDLGGIETPSGGVAIDEDPPFGRRLVATTSDTVIHYLDPGSNRLVSLTRNGDLSQLVEFGLPVRSPTDSDIDRAVSARVEALPERIRPRIARNLRTIVREGPIPVIEYVLASDRLLWIWPDPLLLSSGGDPESRLTLVLDRATLAVRVVSVPPEFRPQGIRGDRIWGFLPDSLGVDRFVAFVFERR